MRKREGRKSIFRGKTKNVHGLLTPIGRKKFDEARGRLANLVSYYNMNPTHISDGDVLEYLARGQANTRDYLAGIAK